MDNRSPRTATPPYVDVATGDLISFPSGNRNHPKREHAQLVAVVNGTDVLVVPICKVYPDAKAPECVIERSDIDDSDIVDRTSFADYANARPLTQASIRAQIECGRLKVTRYRSSWAPLVARVIDGLYVSRQLRSELKSKLPER